MNKTYILIHTHRFGTTSYRFTCDVDYIGEYDATHEKIPDDVYRILDALKIDFETDREKIDIEEEGVIDANITLL